MDFQAALSSDSVKRQASAAVFLPSEGVNGLAHLPALLRCCKKVLVTEAPLPKDEEGLLSFGPVALGYIVGQAGFDRANLFHTEILDWLVDSACSPNLVLSANAIWGLGLLRANQPKAVNCLVSVIEGELREIEHEFVTLRSIALRMLAKIDVALALQFRMTDAWKELQSAYRFWQIEKPIDHLREEFAWMFEAESNTIDDHIKD
jgi:hypothetical protein